jgi:hypothetical protein
VAAKFPIAASSARAIFWRRKAQLSGCAATASSSQRFDASRWPFRHSHAPSAKQA